MQFRQVAYSPASPTPAVSGFTFLVHKCSACGSDEHQQGPAEASGTYPLDTSPVTSERS